jgi:hypothetical protein
MPMRSGPDPHPPRIMPRAVASLLGSLPRNEREALANRLRGKSAMKGVVGSSASVLGKNYLKQVDVVMSDWDTGPELLVSTKRMDSSFGKNAANRVEESYGDAKNLRLRHPLAALGFVYGLRSTILAAEPDKALWLIDLLQKLGNEDDAYHAVALVMFEYESEIVEDSESLDAGPDALIAVEIATPEPELATDAVEISEVEQALTSLPQVVIRHQAVPVPLQPAVFLATMVRRVLDATPVTRHREARSRRDEASYD